MVKFLLSDYDESYRIVAQEYNRYSSALKRSSLDVKDVFQTVLLKVLEKERTGQTPPADWGYFRVMAQNTIKDIIKKKRITEVGLTDVFFTDNSYQENYTATQRKAALEHLISSRNILSKKEYEVWVLLAEITPFMKIAEKTGMTIESVYTYSSRVHKKIRERITKEQIESYLGTQTLKVSVKI